MNVNIRPLEERDAYTSVEWRNDPEIWKLTGSKPNRIITIEDELTWVKKVMAEEDSKRFAIIADEKYVGNIYLTGIANKSAEYHIFIGDKESWGKGIASQASQRLICYTKEMLDISTIHLSVNIKNEAAIYLYKKLGFEATGNINDFIEMNLDIRKHV